VLNFIMHTSFSINFMVWRRTRDIHGTGIQIELHNVFCRVLTRPAQKISCKILQTEKVLSYIIVL
jgi:hypothetical protein